MLRQSRTTANSEVTAGGRKLIANVVYQQRPLARENFDGGSTIAIDGYDADSNISNEKSGNV